MELSNERHLPLPRATVWEALNDPAVLQACIPGCESFDRVDDNTYDATVTAKVGPVKARFNGRVTLTDLDPPASYSMSFQGKGGQAGFVKGSADVSLRETDAGCTVEYRARATLGGKLAQLGNRLVDGAARKTADDFFDRFVEHMGAGEAEAAGDDGSGGDGDDGDDDAGQPPAAGSGRLRSLWPWTVAGAGVLVGLLALAAL